MTVPGALASHSTAAVLHRLPLAFVPQQPCVSVVPWHTGEVDGVHVHRTTSQDFCLPVGQTPCLDIARTVVDLAREHGVPAGVVPLDHAVHHELVTYDELEAALDHCYRWPGVRSARAAVAASDGRSESPLESLSRLKLADFGLPAPELQQSIGDADGRLIGRVDFYWDEFGVIGEVDGLMKYVRPDDDQPNALQREKVRQESLERLGAIVVRWMRRDLVHFGSVEARLRRAFRAGAARPRSARRWTLVGAPTSTL